MKVQDAITVLKAWQADIQLAKQDPAWRDKCFNCGAENAPEGINGPSLRNGWDCYYCNYC